MMSNKSNHQIWRIYYATYNAYAASSAKAPLGAFAFNPGPFGPEEHNKQPRGNNYD